MNPFRHSAGVCASGTSLSILATVLFCCAAGFAPFARFSAAEEPGAIGPEQSLVQSRSEAPDEPVAVTAENFADLLSNSPFLRSLDHSKSLVLTGTARIQGDLFVTVYNRETKLTHVVSGSANSEGWRLVGLDGDPTHLETVTAQISLAESEVFAVRFDEVQLKPSESRSQNGSSGGSGRPGESSSEQRDYREGISGDGFRGAPPPELVAKLAKLSEGQRNELIKRIGEIRDKGDVSSEDRQVMFNSMVDRALQGRR